MLRATLLFSLFMVGQVRAEPVLAIHTKHDVRPVVRHLEKAHLKVNKVTIRRVNIYGEGNRTLLIWSCGDQTIYQYAPPLERGAIREWRDTVVESLSQETFPIVYQD